MAKLKKKIDFTKRKKELSKNHLTPFAFGLITDIRERTQSGKDRNDKAFKSYSKDYKKQKAKEFGSSKVNLTRTSKMLNAITFKEISKGIRFYFSSNEQNTKAFHNQKTRKFFGFSKKETKDLKDELLNIYMKNLKP